MQIIEGEEQDVTNVDFNPLVVEILIEENHVSQFERTEFSVGNSVSLLHFKGTPSAKQLKDFEKDPSTALMALATNSGLGRFSETRYLHVNPLEDKSDLIESLKEEISDNLRMSDKEEIVNKFQQKFNVNAMLIACACCGIREYVMGNTKYFFIPIEELAILKLTDEQITSQSTIPQQYKPVISVYKASRTSKICFSNI